MARKSFKDNPAMKFITSPNSQLETGSFEPQSRLRTDHKAKEESKREEQERSRINIGFTPEEFHYLQAIARLDGVSITQYLNGLITADREARLAELDKTNQ